MCLLEYIIHTRRLLYERREKKLFFFFDPIKYASDKRNKNNMTNKVEGGIL